MQHAAYCGVMLRRTGTARSAGVRDGPGSAVHRSARGGALHLIDGLELAFKIPDNVWPAGAQTIIVVDKTKPFGFGLR